MKYIVNAFSINMLNIAENWFGFKKNIEVERLNIQKEDVKRIFESERGWESAIGHQTTADILGIPCNRLTVKLNAGDELLVAQYVGPRLPEGTTVLPEGSKFEFYRVTIS